MFRSFPRSYCIVIAGLDPAIHLFRIKVFMRWIAGSSPAMTKEAWGPQWATPAVDGYGYDILEPM